MQPVLSICVVTMNRAEQLKEALLSCLACELPKETEFVIIDNASTDNTEDIVRAVLADSEYRYIYEKTDENIGAGKGRCRYYELATGKYVYGMDDDAIVAYEMNPDFFIRAVEIMENNRAVANLATQIYDHAWGCNRLHESGKLLADGLYECKIFCGGSHFIRKSVFKEPPYFPNKYGYEELPPSLLAYDMGYVNGFCPMLLVEHCPKIDKWDISNKANTDTLINECASPYAIKKMMFPLIFQPMIRLAYNRRCKKHLSRVPNGKRRADIIVEDTIQQYPMNKKIKIRTVIRMYKKFGISVF